MEKYIITLIGFDYENKSDNFEVIEDAHIESFEFEADEKEWTKQSIKKALNEFISDVYDKIDDGTIKEELVANAFDKCQLPFASKLYILAIDNEGLTYKISDYSCYGGARL